MNNEFVKVHNEPYAILLRAWMQRKQQQYETEVLQISIQSCTVSWFVLKICEECSYLFIGHTMSYNGSYAPKIIIFNSEFSDSVLLLDIVILILHIPNALLISLTLYSCFHRIDKGMCLIDYKHCSRLGSLPVIWVTNWLAW